MGRREETKASKPEKLSSPAPLDQTTQANSANVHVYPDWAAMQAYYGSRVALPPYYNSPASSGHVPHPYMWGSPQAMMPPYGTPFAAVYSHGGVYAHPGVPLGSNSQTLGIASSPAITMSPLSTEMPKKSSGNTDQGLIKKLKGSNGFAIALGDDGKAESAEGGPEHRLSQSGETEGSTEGSDGNTTGDNQIGKKRSREGTSITGNDRKKTDISASPVTSGEANTPSGKVLGTHIASSALNRKLVGPIVSPYVPSDRRLQSERELKRERRKQSNRESARRSRLRKQAEAEELARKVESLIAENLAIKSEISLLMKNSKKLKQENTTLMEKLESSQPRETGESVSDGTNDTRDPVNTENLLSRVNNAGPTDRVEEEGSDVYKKIPNSGTKLHQLLDTSPRADAIAAG